MAVWVASRPESLLWRLFQGRPTFDVRSDGSLGAGTEAAVIAFQRSEGLLPDGREGRNGKSRPEPELVRSLP